MEWETRAIKRLGRYEARKAALANLADQIKTLDGRMSGIRPAKADGQAVKSGGGNQREDMLINGLTEKDELKENYRIVKREVAVTERGLCALDVMERRVLELFYIRRPEDYIQQLCKELHIERSEVYRRKNDALKKFTIACYGIVEI